MSVLQEAVKLAFCMQISGVCQSQGRFFYIFWLETAILSTFFFTFYLVTSYMRLKLDSNFIANKLRKKIGLRHFSYHTYFHL